MIIEQGGRFQSVRTDAELLELFKRDQDALDPNERALIEEIIRDLKMSGRSPALDALSMETYEHKPVTMERFLDDPYYLGEIGKTLFPIIKQDLIEMFNGHYTEAILSGSIGAAKTTRGAIALIRMVYEVMCLKDPQLSYGITKGDRIVFMGISITEDVANEIVNEKVATFIKNSPFFMEVLRPTITKTKGISFPKDVWIAPGISTESGTIGANCFGVFIDESNFFRAPRGMQGKIHDHVESIYTSIRRRMESRFMNNGKLPGMIIMASSKKSLNSFTERRIKEAISDPDVFCREQALYEIHPSERYSGEKFKVAIGNETRMSRIITDGEPNPDGMQVIEVPVEFKKAFEDDIDAAIRDIAGYSTVSLTPFITRREKLIEAIDHRTHPFSEYIWCQDVQGSFKWNEMVMRDKRGEIRPILNPSAPRHIHLDLSKNNDTTGICMSHISGWKSVTRVGKSEEMLPEYTVDFMLKIEAQTNGEVIQSEIRRLIYELSANNFFIKLITADQYQSLGMFQTLRQRGFKTELVSLDRTSQPYDIVKQIFYENRIHMYRYEPVLKELRELEKNWKTGKVDHPTESGASKDVSDALAGSLFTLERSARMGVGFQQTVETTPISGEDDTWVLEKKIIVASNPNDPKKDKVDWHQELDNHQSGNWKKEFHMPFEIG